MICLPKVRESPDNCPDITHARHYWCRVGLQPDDDGRRNSGEWGHSTACQHTAVAVATAHYCATQSYIIVFQSIMLDIASYFCTRADDFNGVKEHLNNIFVCVVTRLVGGGWRLLRVLGGNLATTAGRGGGGAEAIARLRDTSVSPVRQWHAQRTAVVILYDSRDSS